MSYEIVVEESEKLRAKIVLQEDSYDCNPREDREIATGVVTLPSSRYMDIADPVGTLEDAWQRFSANPYGYGPKDNAVRNFERYVRLLGGVSEVDTPHDGPGAIWYVLPERMREFEVPGHEREITEDMMRRALEAERKEYRAWAEGDVWGVVVERRVVEVTLEDLEAAREALDESATYDTVKAAATAQAIEDDEFIWVEDEDGAVWGYIGQEYAEEEARAQYLTASNDVTFVSEGHVNGKHYVTVLDSGGNPLDYNVEFYAAARQYGYRGVVMSQ